MEVAEIYGGLENEVREFRSNCDLHSLVAELRGSDPNCVGWTDGEGISWSHVRRLDDANKHKEILGFVRVLNQTFGVFSEPTDEIYDYVAQRMGMDPDVVKNI